MAKIAIIKKRSNWNMLKTPNKMHLYDVVKVDTIVFDIVMGEDFKAPPPRIVSCLKYPGSDRVKGIECKNHFPGILQNAQTCSF